MKISLISCTALLLVALNTNAQFAMETFNGVGLPVNWVMVKVDNNIPNAVFDPTIVTNLTTNAWMKWPNVAAGDSSMLTVSYFSTPGTADRWLMTPAFTVTDPNMIIKWQDLVSDPAFADVNEVWVSPTAGITPASYTVQISNLPGGSPQLYPKGVLSSATIMARPYASPSAITPPINTRCNWTMLAQRYLHTLLTARLIP